MKPGPRYHVKPRRRREGKTDFRKRLKLLRSKKTRIVVRKSLKNTRIQFVEYHVRGDRVRVSAVSNELVKYYQWKYSTATTPAAYLIGLLAGKRALEEGITEGVFDIGKHPPITGSKVFAALQGVVDAGVACPSNQEKFPKEERILGKHLNEEIAASVNDIKNKITGGKQ